MNFMEAVKQKENNLDLDIRRKSKPEYTLAVDIVFYHITKDEIKQLRFEDVNATDWEVVEEKKTLWDKMIEAGECCDVFNKCDVKEALKEFIDSFEIGFKPKIWAEEKAKEIFGEELMGDDE